MAWPIQESEARTDFSKGTFACDEEVVVPKGAAPLGRQNSTVRQSMLSRQMSSMDADELEGDADTMAEWMLDWAADERTARPKSVTPALHRAERGKRRVPLLSAMESMSTKNRPFGLSRLGSAVKPMNDQSGEVSKYLVQCDPLELSSTAECPDLLFGSVCLYDVKHEKQISEFYYCNLTSDESILQLLGAAADDLDELKRAAATVKKRDKVAVKAIDDAVIPEGSTLADLLPMDEASIDHDQSIMAQGDTNPKLLDDAVFRHICESAAMREVLREYRREGNDVASAIFSLHELATASAVEQRELHASVFVMVRIEKILEGDPSKVYDLYSKTSEPDRRKLDDSKKQRREAMLRFTRRLGRFRMPFAWAAVPLEDAASLCTGPLRPMAEIEVYQEVCEKQEEEELFRNLTDLTKKAQDRTVTKKLKKLPTILKLRVQKLRSDEAIPRTLTSGLYPVAPFDADVEAPVALEMRSFPAEPVYASHTTYRHDIFVYPKSVNFEKYRNIACKVEFFTDQCIPTQSGHEKASAGAGVIYDRRPRVDKLQSITVPVSYHVKNPSFHEEVKMALPEKLASTDHLLFTFYHVRCKEKQKKEKSPGDVIGYAWHSLVNPMKRVQTGENLELHVAQELPGAYLQKEGASKAKYVDGKKAVFTVSVRLDSTVLSDDLMIQGFMLNTKDYLQSGSADGNAINLATGVRNLKDADPLALMQFMPVVTSQLIGVIKVSPNRQQVLVQETFTALCHIVETAHTHPPNGEAKRSAELASFIKHKHHIYGFEGRPTAANQSGILHEELVYWLNKAVTGYATRAEPWAQKSHSVCVKHTWFFLELIIKSLAQHMEIEKKKTTKGDTPRAGLTPEFLADLRGMILGLVQCAKTKDAGAGSGLLTAGKLPEKWADRLIASVGFALRDLLTYINRSECFALIHDVFKLLHCGKTVDGLAAHRIDLLEIICSHEHFVPLNFPVDLAQKAGLVEEINKEYLAHHYLVGLLLCEVKSMLYSENGSVRAEAIKLLGRILSTHDADGRYKEKANRYRLYRLYFPVIPMILEFSDRAVFSVPNVPSGGLEAGLVGASSAMSHRLSESESLDLIGIFMHVVSRNKPSTFRDWFKSKVPQTKKSLLYLVRLGVYGMEYPGSTFIKAKVHSGSEASTKRAVGAMAQLENLYKAGGSGAADRLAARRVQRQTAVDAKSGQSRPMSTAVGVSSGTTLREMRDGRSSSLSRRPMKTESLQSTTSNYKKEDAAPAAKPLERYASRTDLDTVVGIDSPKAKEAKIAAESARLGEMSDEVGLIALDIADALIEDSKSDLENPIHIHLLRHLVEVLVAIMQTKSSNALLAHLFKVMQTFVCQFSRILFGDVTTKGRPEICSQFCEETMKLCSSHVQQIRELASAFLYLMMRRNFRSRKNKEFARVKVQVTIGLSKVVGTSQQQQQSVGVEVFMKRSLATIIAFSKNDRKKVKDMAKTTFPDDVSNLVMNLYNILADTSQIRDFAKDKSDPDHNMSIELHYRIAESYKTSPRIRIEWLDTLSKIHEGCKQYAEAGFCMVHSAAIVAEKLMDINRENWLPQGCKGLEVLSKNVMEEALTGALHQKNVDEDDEGTFHAGKLEALLIDALAHFQNAKMYEYMNDIYKILVPIYEASRNYTRLQSVYGQSPFGFADRKTDKRPGLLSMSECYQKIELEEMQHKRFFGTFFRIGFYSKDENLLPIELHNQEYISREPSLTSLSSLCLKLKDQFEQLSEDGTAVEIIHETYDVDAARIETFDENKIYLQVTHVEPSLTQKKSSKEMQRVSIFERNTNISSFVYETPFTETGKSRGSIADQKLRKTTLQVEKLKSFPYIKKRLKVLKKTQIELSPIEFAIDSVEKKIVELQQVVNAEIGNVDIKLLQLKLQGSVSVSVNEGPAKMAQVFLSKGAAVTDKKSVRKLKQKFGQFLELCSKGLDINKAKITESQHDYHLNLAAGFTALEGAIAPLLETAGAPAASCDQAMVISPMKSVVSPMKSLEGLDGVDMDESAEA